MKYRPALCGRVDMGGGKEKKRKEKRDRFFPIEFDAPQKKEEGEEKGERGKRGKQRKKNTGRVRDSSSNHAKKERKGEETP